MCLSTPKSVEKLQTALHIKAKRSPGFRFYSLYDKVYRSDVLAEAYRRCRRNGGAAGVDDHCFVDIETYGLERWLGELADEFRHGRYVPQAVRRVRIPKPDGGERPLGIPTIRDRVAQTATLLLLEPIFEADFPDEQYAYRNGRNAQQALERISALLNQGHREVVDADMKGYFDSIPHAELLKSVARRVSDGRILRLIKQWLTAPVEEIDHRGWMHRTTRNKDTKRGTPQGVPISPLLSNVYMRRFILGWKQLGFESRLQGHIVNYADDFVICCRAGYGRAAMQVMRDLMACLKLTVNESKTRLCGVPQESFDFLGYTFGQLWSRRSGRSYLGCCPSQKSMRRIRRAISERTGIHWCFLSEAEQAGRLNRLLVGWQNYFKVGTVWQAYGQVDHHLFQRLRQWWCGKHKVRNRRDSRFSCQYVYRQLGVVQLRARRQHFS